ncbi:hypothetical protein [Sphaerisporangium fuscum]|uniref:hypothetical protein n=1 Tax=Sphaerisporangium fuscum TaxID=2835868 RepID=UPI001BDC937B|nr:hypothetical protein [Sphaerisporangium fuscum]
MTTLPWPTGSSGPAVRPRTETAAHDQLIEKFGNPIYKYDLGEVAEAFRRLSEALPSEARTKMAERLRGARPQDNGAGARGCHEQDDDPTGLDRLPAEARLLLVLSRQKVGQPQRARGRTS